MVNSLAVVVRFDDGDILNIIFNNPGCDIYLLHKLLIKNHKELGYDVRVKEETLRRSLNNLIGDDLVYLIGEALYLKCFGESFLMFEAERNNVLQKITDLRESLINIEERRRSLSKKASYSEN